MLIGEVSPTDMGIDHAEQTHTSDEYMYTSNVEGFINNVWHHPLVTPETEKLRAGLDEVVTNHFQSIGIESDQYFALPHGSIIGFANSDSDIDIFAVMTETAAFKYHDSAHGGMGVPKLPKDDVQLGNYETTRHLIHQISQGDLGAHNAPLIVALLVTPEELVVGDRSMLRQTRLKLVQALRSRLNTSPQETQKALDYYDYIFRSHYSGWPEYSSGVGEFNQKPDGSREERYRDILNNYTSERAAGSKVIRKQQLQEKLASTVEKSRDSLHLDFVNLFAYIEDNEGRLG